MESRKYSPLREAHQRIKNEQEAHSAKEVTDRQVERGERQTDRPERESTDRVQRSTEQEPERREAGSDRRMPVPSEPAPDESVGHWQWRVRTIENMERNRQREERWEAIRKGQGQSTTHNNQEQSQSGKPVADAEVERGEE